MNPVDRLDRTLDLLRRQLADRAGRLDRGHGSADTAARGSAHAGQSLGPLRERIVERLRALPRDDARGEQRARRVLLESVLVSEFGADVQNDARFGELIDHVQAAMASHPESDRRLRELIADLTKP